MIGAFTVGSVPVGGATLGAGSASPGLTVWINGEDRTDDVFIGSDGSAGFQVSNILTGSTTAQLALISKDGVQLDLEVGYEVIVEVLEGRLFGGTIEDIRMENPAQSLVLNYDLRLRDYSAALERRLVAASFEDTGTPITQTVGDIITTIHASLLADGVITLGTIEDGPLVSKINFNYVTVLRALNDLQRLTGNTFQWQVDFWGVLTFTERSAKRAPYDLLGVDELTMQSFDFGESRETYRNRQTVRGGKTTSDNRTDNFEADGKNKTFVCSLPLAGKPVIEVNTVAVDPAKIGIKGAEEDDPSITWFFEVDDPDVSARVAPSNGDDIDITYQGLFPIVVQRELPGEIASRAAIEPGDGIYENVDVDENLDLISARTKADALLDKYARIPKRIQFLTKKVGLLQAGQLLSVQFSRFGARVTAEYMIDEVEILLIGNENILEYSVSATEGREYLEWLEFWREIVAGRAPFIIRDNEKLILPIALTEQLELTDTASLSLSNQLRNWKDDPYTHPILNTCFSIGKRIQNGEADGPHLGPILGTIGLLEGLVLYYKGAEVSGTRVDSHTNTLDMAQTGFVGSATGIKGLCPAQTQNPANILDRVHNDLFRIGASPATINAWFQIGSGQQFFNHPILSHWNSNGGATQRGWILWYRTSTQRLRFSVSDDGVGTTITEVDWSAGQPLDSSWHMVTAFHDPANARIGITVDASTSIVWLAHAPAVINPTTTARPAWGVFRGSTVIVAGQNSDEVAFWKRLLTQDELNRLYGGGTPIGYDDFK